MESLVCFFVNHLKTRSGRCKALWILSGIFFIIAVFSGPGQPILPFIISQEISKRADKWHQEPIYQIWQQGEETIAKIDGRSLEKSRQQKQTLLASWKWWIIFKISFLVSLFYTVAVILLSGLDFGERTFQISGQKLKEVWTGFIQRRQLKAESKAKIKTAIETAAAEIGIGQKQDDSAKLFLLNLLAELAWELISKTSVKMQKILKKMRG